MRIVIDYRPALRERTGVGEYVHQLARALRQLYPDDSLTLFSSSWKDRPGPALTNVIPGAQLSDHRVPVSVLNLLWHRAEWPRIELLTGAAYDIAFSPHPLLLPARAAQVVMVHDLDFLTHPERAQREIRRDYPRLAADHAQRARAVIVPSEYTRGEVQQQLRVPGERIVVCSPGIPEWRASAAGFRRDGYVLFMGSLERRKNIAGLLTAYSRIAEGWSRVPRLVLAGRPGSDIAEVLDRTRQSPLAGHVDQLGYVADSKRQDVLEGARVLVLPSLEEGFGMPALEAMSLGIPVVVSARGALPEVVGDAGLVFEPTDEAALFDALSRVLTDDDLAQRLGSRGRERARSFSWHRTAMKVRTAFAAALERRADQ